MAGPYDFESLYGLDPDTAAMLRSKYAPDAGAAAAGGAPAVPQGGAFDLSAALNQQLGPPPAPKPAGPPPAFDLSAALNSQFGAPPSAPKVDAVTGQPAYDGTSKILAAAPAQPYAPPKPPATPTEAAAEASGPPRQVAPNYGGGGGGATVIPGGWRPFSEEREVTRKGSPEDLKAIRAASDSAAGHSLLSADAGLRAANRDVATDLQEFARRQEVAERYDAVAARVAAERAQYVEQSKAKLQSMSEELAKDPTAQYWASKTDGEKVMGFLGVILSGIGAGLTGGPNLALQKIENEINRGLANRRDAFNRQRSVYQEMLQEYGDRATAIQAAKVAAYDKVAQDLAPMRALAKTDRALEDYEKIVSGVEAQRAKALAEYGALEETKLKSRDTYTAPQVVGGAGGKPLSNLVTLSDGTTYQLQNESITNDTVKQLQASTSLNGLYQEAAQLRASVEKAPAGSVERKRAFDDLNRLTEKIINLESVAEGQGQVKEGEMGRLLEKSPLMKGLRSRTLPGAALDAVNPFRSDEYAVGNQQIQAALERNKKREEALVRAARGAVVDERAGIDPRTGKVEFDRSYTGQVATPEAPLPPAGFKAFDSRVKQPTMGQSGRDKLPFVAPKGKK